MSAQRKGPRIRKVGAAKPKLPTPIKRPVKSFRFLKPSYRLLAPTFRLISKVTPPYFKNSWTELRQVTWPGRGETWKLTSAVFVFAVVFGAAVLGVDKILDEIFKKVILK